MRKILFFILCAAVICAADETIDILQRETGIRALGMGGTFTGVASDTSALYYNPAGLAVPGLQFTYSEDDLSKRFYEAGIDSTLKYGNIGFGRRRFVDDDSHFVDIQSLGFGVRNLNGIDYGLAYRQILQETPTHFGTAWTADIGLMFNLMPSWKAGVNIQNIARQGIDTDPSFRLGTAYNWKQLLFAYDVELYSDEQSQSHYGMEWQAADGFTLRVGSNQNNFTYGVSIGLGDLIWEYAIEREPEEIVYRFAFKLGSEHYPKVRSYSIIRQKEVLQIELDAGFISGHLSETSVFGGRNTALDQLIQKIRVAAEDKNIAAMIIRIQDLSNNISYAAVVQELRAELEAFKQKGKPIIVYIENNLSANAYYLATVADRIVMPSMGSITPVGKSLTVTRLRGLLEKIGLTPVIINTGEHKAALNPFSENFTDKQREQISGLVQDVNNELLNGIRTARDVSTQNMADIADGSLIPAREALSYKLVDALGYYDTAENQLRELLSIPTKNDPAEVTDLVYVRPAQLPILEVDTSIFPNYSTIAVVDIDGEIIDGESQSDFLFGGRQSGAETICKELRNLRNKDHVKAVVVRINSPGGSPFASDRIYRELLKLKENKKYIVVSVGNMAASGGYYIAAAGDEIYANSTALVGSIGVIGQTFKAGKLFQELGIVQENIKTAEHADMDDISRDLTEDEMAMFLRYQASVYDQFKLVVAQGRNLHVNEVESLAQGKIYTARRAQELKLVDKLGTFSDALDAAKKGAKIKGQARIIRNVQTESGWLQLRYNLAVALGLDKLALKSFIKETPAELHSYIY